MRIETAQDLRELGREFQKETDRAVVIVGASRIDALLEEILTTFLRPVPGLADPLLDADGPIGPFSARITLAHRLGLIAEDVARALHLVRRIRNDCAHQHDAIDLGKAPHADRIRELARPWKSHDRWDALQSVLAAEKTGPSADMRVVICLLLLRLQGLAKACGPIDCSRQLALVPPEWPKNRPES